MAKSKIFTACHVRWRRDFLSRPLHLLHSSTLNEYRNNTIMMHSSTSIPKFLRTKELRSVFLSRYSFLFYTFGFRFFPFMVEQSKIGHWQKLHGERVLKKRLENDFKVLFFRVISILIRHVRLGGNDKNTSCDPGRSEGKISTFYFGKAQCLMIRRRFSLGEASLLT